MKKFSIDLYNTQLKLLVPILASIYSLKLFGYASNVEPITFSLISIAIFMQSYIFLSNATFCYNGKDKIYTYITLICAFLYCSSLKFMIGNFGILGAAASRFFYFAGTIFLGFILNKLIFSKRSIVNYRNSIIYPILKISFILFLLNYFGIFVTKQFI
tara:strand:- start:201 stop:674 length:474 start_codon:yes stop_codon:yes gene_type:complete